MAWVISSFGSSFVCFMKESFFTNIESRSSTKFNTLCVQHMDFRLSRLQRNNKFFVTLTHMDNERHVCKRSLTCPDILNSLVTFSLTPFFPINPGSVGSVFKKYSFKFSYCSIILPSTLSRLSQQVWQCFIT